MAIKLQFVCGSGISSRLIAWYGNGYGGYSHVDAVLPDGRLIGARSDTIGGVKPGVQIRKAGYEKWIRRDVVSLRATPAESRIWLDWLMSQIGVQYDTGSIWGFILGKELHQVGHWICSACQTEAIKKTGHLRDLPVPPSQVTPNSLLLMVVAMGGVIE